ncbi:hypothetical protein VLK31_25675 [Variovorax sp. H27-G14]|uniref:hypothetical protein n=1 Tax=Variovorax sp. H27-G14 TaxID=3111914 RepID=UPI0038FCCF14
MKKNKQVAQEIKKAADELVVVHAVLEKELGEDPHSETVDQAVAHTAQIEKRLDRSAKELDEVNRELEGGGGKGKREGE